MHNLALVSRVNVLTAIRDHDLQGAGAFLEGLGFEGPGDEVVVVRGKRYDARALLAYAHGKATGEFLDPERISVASLQVLTDLEFTVATRAELERPAAPAARARAAGAAGAAPRASRPAKPAAAAKPVPVVPLCPSCFTQLSVTGVCDFCD